VTNSNLNLEELTLRQLRRLASDYGISRYSRMRKSELVEGLRELMQSPTAAAPNSTPATSLPQTEPVVSAQPTQPQMPKPQTTSAEVQERVEATKFEVGQEDLEAETLASVDEGLPDLPSGYGESRIVLLPRDPQWAYVYWDVPGEHKESLRAQGGQQLALRLYDATDVNLDYQSPHSLQEYPCDELAREWYLPVPLSDRDYVIDIGYRCADGRWLVLARSVPVHIPPVYPSDWVEDQFITVSWDESLAGKTFLKLVPPAQRSAQMADGSIYGQIFEMAQGTEAQRVAGSLYGSMQHVPGSVYGSVHMAEQAVSSYVFPSGVGMWATMSGAGLTMSGMGMEVTGPTLSGVGMTMSGVGMAGLTASGVGMTMSGVGMAGLTLSGVGMSGVGFSASAAPIRPRKFWLVADAELIVYGATEPDATVTIGGRPIRLNEDGTFRFQMAFPDGIIDYPILAVAADGEQSRSIHMHFERETPERRTNTKEEAVLEWLS